MEQEKIEKEQLYLWNKKHGRNLSLNDFFYECPHNIKKSELQEFPLLQEIWVWVNNRRRAEEIERKEYQERLRQPLLFDEVENDFPF